MSLSLYESSVPVYERGLNAFLAILDRAEEHAQARKFDPNAYLAMRLSPDMFPFVRQVQSFCDHAKNSSFRLAAKDPPVKEDKRRRWPNCGSESRRRSRCSNRSTPRRWKAASRERSSFPPGRTS